MSPRLFRALATLGALRRPFGIERQVIGAATIVRGCTRRWAMSARGHSRPSHPAPMPTDVRFAPSSDQNIAAPRLVAMCRLCCKSRKLQGYEFFAKIQHGQQSPIRITSIALPKSPVSFARGDEVPHIFTRNARLQLAEFLIIGAKRLLQHNRPKADCLQNLRSQL